MKSASDILRECQETIAKMQKHPGVGKAIIAELGDISRSVEPSMARLAEIESLYDWSIGGDREEEIKRSFAEWNAMQPGKAVDISGHAKNSPLLRGFYQKGVDFKRSRIFTPDEEKFSEVIGKNYDKVHDIVSTINRARDLENGKFSALVRQRQGLFKELGFFKDAIDLVGVQIKTKEDRWAPAKSEWMRDSDQQTRFLFKKKNPALHALLMGHWMTCYVKNIIKDHFERNNKIFEIYANVSYDAPPDVIRSSSDFDVIGMTGDSIFCVECKSGRIDEKRNDVAGIGDRIADIQTVLETFAKSDQNINFSLVYNPFSNKDASIFKPLTDNDIDVLKPSDVRGAVARLTN